ncbi:PhoPQ-activated protein PqaA family protein [Agriterribacter sp.]|uniref:PhoPQ-activated pathogenicity-related family protein n=1 Tax=Agriterribacter sp. TaxID=2821509 RepID=UPI002B9327C7|nr:PhoPQ-activated protein PqaA family protein [Agriterribacter sp.]HRO45477.1 PhoPQ-activated protein PqaA family protein [Agriterribacter sp.]HRQ18894.1 PhoPQ-activated protein PqaA family protein [Agriterribacter sp.]
MKKIYLSVFVFLVSFLTLVQAQVTPSTALQSYLHNGDKTFKWEVKDTYDIGDVKAYALLLTSQQWREHVWTHQLTVLVPKENKYDGALLFITGGSIKNGLPNWNGRDDKFNVSMADMAATNHAIVAVLRQTPNQPLYNDLTEDELISFTLHNFKKDGDYSWPLLFPMVKSAVRAMDAIQEFSKQQLNHPVNRFVVSGASKRGWTTWLTGANDKRAQAIAPMVIDVLNMPVSLDYQIKALGDYSVQIEDYVKLGIPQGAKTESGMAVTTMVDPYSYRKTLTMPKLIFMGTNDEYWVVDNIKNYIDSIPGKNLLHYVPNAGHNLGGGAQAFQALGAFFGSTLTQTAYPECKWTTSVSKKGVKVNINATKDELTDVIVWHADSPDTDFRNDKWTSNDLNISQKKKLKITEALPASGYRAFYVDLKYKAVNGGTYTVSTRVFMTDTKTIL